MKSSRQPYQSPELIILGHSAEDTSHPTEKFHNVIEYSWFGTTGLVYNHVGPYGVEHSHESHPGTATLTS
jgi:hypothetical protein